MSDPAAADPTGSVNPEELPDPDETPTPQGPESPFDGDNEEPDISDGSEANTADSIISRLSSTEPDPDLENVSDPWNPQIGGKTRVYRGFMKISGSEGMPAWYDIGVGVIEIAVEYYDETGDEPGSESDGTAPDEPTETHEPEER